MYKKQSYIELIEMAHFSKNDFFQKMEKSSLFYSRVEPGFKILYSYVYNKQSYIELIEIAHFPKKNYRKKVLSKKQKKPS